MAKKQTEPKKEPKKQAKPKKTLAQELLDDLVERRDEVDAVSTAVAQFRNNTTTSDKLRKVLDKFKGTTNTEGLINELSGQLLDFDDEVKEVKQKTVDDEVAALRKKKFG